MSIRDIIMQKKSDTIEEIIQLISVILHSGDLEPCSDWVSNVSFMLKNYLMDTRRRWRRLGNSKLMQERAQGRDQRALAQKIV